jgi:hypothetical protein
MATRPRTPRRAKSFAAKPAVPSEAAKAFVEVEPELQKVSRDELVAINVDIPRAVSVAIGAIPRLAQLRGDATKLHDFDVANIDRLGTYALAAWYAHLLALPETMASTLTQLLERARPLREDMLLAAELLAHKGYFDNKAVEAIRAGQGNLDTANDLVALAGLFSAVWPQVEHRSTVEWDDVEQASLVGPQILIALGERNQSVDTRRGSADLVERRARAYSLFWKAYDQCRRAASYLRWNHGDADEFAPSLHVGRSGRKPGPGKEPDAGEPESGHSNAPA